MNIYVGNLSRDVSETDLKEAFQAFGEVASAAVIKDKYTGESRGFGFVEMPNKEEADKAISGLNGKDMKGRTITVNEARPRRDDRRGSGFGGGRGGSRGGFGRGGGGRRPGDGAGARAHGWSGSARARLLPHRLLHALRFFRGHRGPHLDEPLYS